MSTIVDQHGQPITHEIASIKRDVLRATFGLVLENTDDTLMTRGRSKGLLIYDELERDAQAGSVLQKRKLAVIARPWVVDPASDAAPDKAAAELVRSALGSLKFNRICYELLDAVLKGFSVGEVMWEIRDGKVMPRDVKPRNQRRFVFDYEEQLRLRTHENPLEGEVLPGRKFIVHRFGSKDGSPYGQGVGRSLFWPVFFKKQDIAFWLTFLDKFGSPTAVGKYPSGSPESEQRKLLAILRAISQDSGIVLPEGMVVEFMEATRSGSTDAYERMARYMDEQISLAVLGETMTSNAQAAGLGSGQAQVHNDVRIELSMADADLLSDTLNDTLVRWIVEYNMPGAALPSVRREFEEPEDLVKRSQRDANLVQMGLEPDDDYIVATYGEGWRRKAEPAFVPMDEPAAPTAGGRQAGAELANEATADDDAAFAEGAPLQAVKHRDAHRQAMTDIDAASTALAGQWQEVLAKPVQDIVSLLEETGDLVQFRERLTRLVTAPPADATVNAIARATFAGHLMGRAAASRKPAPKPGFTAGLKRLFTRKGGGR